MIQAGPVSEAAVPLLSDLPIWSEVEPLPDPVVFQIQTTELDSVKKLVAYWLKSPELDLVFLPEGGYGLAEKVFDGASSRTLQQLVDDTCPQSMSMEQYEVALGVRERIPWLDDRGALNQQMSPVLGQYPLQRLIEDMAGLLNIMHKQHEQGQAWEHYSGFLEVVTVSSDHGLMQQIHVAHFRSDQALPAKEEKALRKRAQNIQQYALFIYDLVLMQLASQKQDIPDPYFPLLGSVSKLAPLDIDTALAGWISAVHEFVRNLLVFSGQNAPDGVIAFYSSETVSQRQQLAAKPELSTPVQTTPKLQAAPVQGWWSSPHYVRARTAIQKWSDRGIRSRHIQRWIIEREYASGRPAGKIDPGQVCWRYWYAGWMLIPGKIQSRLFIVLALTWQLCPLSDVPGINYVP